MLAESTLLKEMALVGCYVSVLRSGLLMGVIEEIVGGDMCMFLAWKYVSPYTLKLGV